MLSSMVVDPSLSSADKIRPLSRLEYERMVELGFFDEDPHIELLDGVLVKMSPQGWNHALVVEWLSDILAHAIARSLRVRTQLPFAAGAYAEPEPDIAVVPRHRRGREHPREALLIVEVAGKGTLKTAREAKLHAYAGARAPEYWIVNLENMTVEVYTKPLRGRYARKQVLRDGDVLCPTKLPGIEVAVADLPR